MDRKTKILDFDLFEPKDISDAFVLVCRRLDLNQKTEEAKCFKGGKVDYTVMVNLANRYDLKLTLDFKLHMASIEYMTLVDDIRTPEQVVSDERKRKLENSQEMIAKLAGSKKKDEKVIDDIEITEPEDNFEIDDLDFDLESE